MPVFRLRAQGVWQDVYYCDCEYCRGHRVSLKFDFDEQVEAYDLDAAKSELYAMVEKYIQDETDAVWWRAIEEAEIEWSIAPSVRAVSEATLMLQRGERTLFSVGDYN
jgi:hypothetical protein